MQRLFDFPTKELMNHPGPWLSIVLSLSTEDLSSDKDHIKFKNDLDQARQLIQGHNQEDALLEQLNLVEGDSRHLLAGHGGLAIYIQPEASYYYRLAGRQNDRVHFGDLPQIHALIAHFQTLQSFHVLVLNRESMALYRYQDDTLETVDMPDDDAPVDLETALGTEKTGGELAHGTFGSKRGASGPGSFHGHNDTSSQKDIDRVNYFQAVDQYIQRHFSAPTHLPLVVYALEENATLFKELSKNTYLYEHAIEKSGAQASHQERLEQVRDFAQEQSQLAIQSLKERLDETSPDYLIVDQPTDLAMAVVQGRIETLVVEQGYRLPGLITDEGRYQDDADHDFVSHLIHDVIAQQGNVYLLPADQMPETGQLIARLRY